MQNVANRFTVTLNEKINLCHSSYKNVYIGRSPIQNCINSGTPHFSKPQTNMDVSSQRNLNTSTKYKIKSNFFFKFVACFQYFNMSSYYMC